VIEIFFFGALIGVLFASGVFALLVDSFVRRILRSR
jgi:hypothetical protein